MRTDLEIQHDVIEELKWEPLLKANEIGVAVTNGIVMLSGEVDNFSKKIAAEKAAKKVKGVKAVAEEIEVKLSSSGWRSDAEIAESIINALKWHSSVPDEAIKIKVEKGWVTIEGKVEWAFEKNSAANIIIDMVGVRGLTNLVKIAPKIEPKDVKHNINAAFHRSASLDASKIKVDILGNTVTLKGIVHSLTERKDAETAAWAAPGVTEVKNLLIVENQLLVNSEGKESLIR